MSAAVADITLAGWMARRCERTPDRKALSYQGETWTYRELQERIQACAEQLSGAGLCAGDRVAYVDLNNASFFVTLFAASQLGAIFVPLNFRLTSPELAFILSDAGVKVIVAGDEHRAIIDRSRADIPCETYVSTGGAEEGWLGLQVTSTGVQLPDVATDPSDVAIVMYTSGTTGRPKGAMLTHANLWWNNVNGFHAFDVVADDVTLLVMPIFHIGSLNTLGLSTLQKGGHAVLMRSFEPGATLEAIEASGATTLMAVPTAFRAMAEHEAFDASDLSTMRMMVCGGSPCPVELMRAFLRRGIVMTQGWGLTEASPMATFLTSDYAESKVGSAGASVMFCDVRLVDATGNTVTESHVQGEAYVRGPNIMKGYWNNPTATAAVLSEDGWLRTGDIAYRDPEGFFYIVDRAKDMIISGAENIYPAEVETALRGHPAIADVAVIGVPDQTWGESVAAVVVLHPGKQLSIDELREWSQASLARYKLPRVLHVVNELPRNATGKILKFQLRTAYGGAGAEPR